MNVILGIDQLDHAEQIINLFSRLDLDRAHYELVNIVDTTLPVMPVGAATGVEFSS